MKTNLKTIFLLTIGITLALVGCKKEEILLNDIENHPPTTSTNPNIIEMIEALKLGTKNDRIFEDALPLPSGFSEPLIFINDIMISKKELLKQYNELQNGKNGLAAKHYRTKNIIASKNRTINIVGINKSDDPDNDVQLSKDAQNGLKDAVAAYNNLKGHSLKFKLKFVSWTEENTEAADIVVYDISRTERGGLDEYNLEAFANFPEDGYAGFQIYVNKVSHLDRAGFTSTFIHELGHTIGFRHTDWDNPISCATKPEKPYEYGAIHIKGTKKVTSNSIFIACPSEEALTSEDKTAIKKVYPPKKKKKKKKKKK